MLRTVSTRPAPSSIAPVRDETRHAHAQSVLRALVFVEARLQTPLDLAAMARAAHMSPFHFQRIFTEIVGESPSAFVRRIRLERAAAAVARGEPLARCAEVAGFTRIEPFTRRFKRVFGRPPGSWRAARVRDTRPVTAPREARVWINRPTADAQLRFVPVGLDTPHARGRRAIRIEFIVPTRLAFIRRTGAGSASEREDFRRLTVFAHQHRGPAEEPFMLRLRHDNPDFTPNERVRIDRCIGIGPRRRADSGIGVRTIPTGTYAVATHQGAPRTLGRFARWIERAATTQYQCVRRDGPIIEIPLDDPRAASAGRGSSLTDVLVPVHPPAMTPAWYVRRRRPLPPT
jgi:AraC family transcriptional regulator